MPRDQVRGVVVDQVGIGSSRLKKLCVAAVNSGPACQAPFVEHDGNVARNAKGADVVQRGLGLRIVDGERRRDRENQSCPPTDASAWVTRRCRVICVTVRPRAGSRMA